MKQFAVFDIDGTLIRWQLYHAVVDKLAKMGTLGSDAHEKIHEARMKWKRRETEEGFKQYEQALVALYEQTITSVSPQDFDTAAAEVIIEYRDQVYTYTRKLIKTLKNKGYILLAISGSQQELVTKIADYYGFDDCIATEYGRAKNKFTGNIYVASHDKKAALEKLIQKYTLDLTGSYAIGDSKSDVPLLERVENPIAFNPDKALFKAAAEHNWKVVIERKNMVYELEPQNGRYILA